MKGIKSIIRIDDTYTDDDIDNIRTVIVIAEIVFAIMIAIAARMGII